MGLSGIKRDGVTEILSFITAQALQLLPEAHARILIGMARRKIQHIK